MSDDHSISSASVMTTESNNSLFFNKDQPIDYSCEFKLIQSNNLIHRSIHFIASSLGEKQAWCGDISQVNFVKTHQDLIKLKNPIKVH